MFTSRWRCHGWWYKIAQFMLAECYWQTNSRDPSFARVMHPFKVQEKYECTIIPDKNVSPLDVPDSSQPMLKHEKKVELWNGQTSLLKTDYSTDDPGSSLKQVTFLRS